MNRAIAIIPARGGSKRIPRKNIRPFAGRPAIIHAIECALRSECFQEVMVSTDCQEIAEISRGAGASIPFLRAQNTSDDHATTIDVLAEVLAAYREQRKTFDTGCCIYPVTPFLTGTCVRRAMALLTEDSTAESVVPVLRYAHPVQRALAIRAGSLQMMDPRFTMTRTQDLEIAYHDAGQLYAFKVEALLRNRSIFSLQTRALVLRDDEAHDIDSLEDWEAAELKYAILHERMKFP